MPFIALAVLAGSAYQATQQRNAANQARAEAQRANMIATQQMEQQINVQREQAKIARDRMAYEIEQNASNKAELDKQAKQMADDLEAEKRRMGEQEASRLKSMRRSGSRSLLSDARLNPELGLGTSSDTFGSGTQI